MDISLVTALLGGALALLSPCGALLLPAFFAATVGSGPRLLLHGGVFYAGLTATLVPLGLGIGAVGSLVTAHRGAIILTTAVLLVVLGLAQMAGFGFDFARLLPGARALSGTATARTGLPRTLLLGAASGVAGFCAGPILGAVLTLAAAQGEVGFAGLLLAFYGAGMVLPLLALAAFWGRFGTRGRRALRGRAFTVLGRELHTTSVVTGALITGVGVLFWTTNGLVAMPELVPVGVQTWIQEQTGTLAHPVVDVLVVLAAAAGALLVWNALRRRRARGGEPPHHPAATSEEPRREPV